MDPPSVELEQTLAKLRLASAADLRGCAGLVRRLARGLPVTDTVWLDALVRRGKLTPFQARSIEERRTIDLLIDGRWILCSLRHADPVLSLFDARDIQSGRRFLLSQVSGLGEEGIAAALRLTKTAKTLATRRGLFPAAPGEAIWERGFLYLLSPFGSGESLSRLLIRRGRFPEEVVRSLAGELARQLLELESLAVHGDVRAANVWLTAAGELLLLNYGVLPAIAPEISIHTRLPYDSYDTIAPERIDGSREASTVGDIYGLGCLLWQLLSGRPPYCHAEPLAKLQAHCTRQIPDVRTFAPQVSESLALLVQKMTVKEPHRRPQSFGEVLEGLDRRMGQPRLRLKRFLQTFESEAPCAPIPGTRRSSAAQAAAVAIFSTASLLALAWHRDRLGLPGLAPVAAATQAENKPPPVAPTQPQTWPVPGSDGTVVLEGNQPYPAVALSGASRLILKADPDRPATIRVGDEPLRLVADVVRLENIRIVVEAHSRASSPVQVQAQELVLQRCRCEARETGSAVSLVEWSVRAAEGSGAGRLHIMDTVFLAAGTAIECRDPLTTALLENVFADGARPLVQLRSGVHSGLKVPLVLNRCTLRNCGPVASFPTGSIRPRGGRLSLQGTDTVIDLPTTGPLLEVTDSAAEAHWSPHVEIAAQGLITQPGIMLAGSRRGPNGRWQELDSSPLTVDGLLSGEFHFREVPDAHSGLAEVLIDSLAVRQSPRSPGADLSRLLP